MLRVIITMLGRRNNRTLHLSNPIHRAVFDFFGNLGLQRGMLHPLPHRLYTDMDKMTRKLVDCSILQIRSQLDSA